MNVRHSTWIAVLAVVATALATGWLASSAGARSVHSAIVCPIGWADANMLAADGCETNLAVDLWNCGRLNNPVPVGGRCVNGVPLDAKGKPVTAPAPKTDTATTTMSTASPKPPATFDFTLASNPRGPSEGLAQSQGDPVCTGSGSSLVCTQAIGVKTAYKESVSMKDNATGASGSMSIDCTIMYAGVMTTYAAKPGTADATGSQDCTVTFDLMNGDIVNGAFHEQRVLRANREVNTFAMTFTGGSGRYAGFQGTFSSSHSNDWTAPNPLDSKGTDVGPKSGSATGSGGDGSGNKSGNGGGQSPLSCPSGFADADGNAANGCEVDLMTDPRNCGRVGNIVAAGNTCVSGVPTGPGTRTTQIHRTVALLLKSLAGRISVRLAKRPLADFASLGLLVPSNRPLDVRVVAAPGSTCWGGFGGTRNVTLGKTKAGPTGIVRFPTIAAGTFGGEASVTASLTCAAPGATTPAEATVHLRTYAVGLKK